MIFSVKKASQKCMARGGNSTEEKVCSAHYVVFLWLVLTIVNFIVLYYMTSNIS